LASSALSLGLPKVFFQPLLVSLFMHETASLPRARACKEKGERHGLSSGGGSGGYPPPLYPEWRLLWRRESLKKIHQKRQLTRILINAQPCLSGNGSLPFLDKYVEKKKERGQSSEVRQPSLLLSLSPSLSLHSHGPLLLANLLNDDVGGPSMRDRAFFVPFFAGHLCRPPSRIVRARSKIAGECGYGGGGEMATCGTDAPATVDVTREAWTRSGLCLTLGPIMIVRGKVICSNRKRRFWQICKATKNTERNQMFWTTWGSLVVIGLIVGSNLHHFVVYPENK